MHDIAVIGEAVADAFLSSASQGQDVLDLRVRPGGGPANTAVALARLGTRTRFIGRIAGGPFGRLLRDHLSASGVSLTASVAAKEQATLAVTTVDAAGQASYEFYTEGTADWQWTREELEERHPEGVSCVHAGSLALALTPGGPLIEELLERVRPSATVSIDPNVRPGVVPPGVYQVRLTRTIGLADIMRVSDEDLSHLGMSADAALDTWHGHGVRLVVVTRGARGAVGSLDGVRVTVPAVDVEPVDTVGAGDAFTAGLLHWLRRSGHLGGRMTDLTAEDVRRAMEFAALVAAETCRVPGADPPWGESMLIA